MPHLYRFILLGLAAWSGALSAQPTSSDPAPPIAIQAPPVVMPPAPRPPLAAEDPDRRFPLRVPASQDWPAPMPLRALPSSPDWVGDEAYPPEAHRQEMEGQVSFEALVGADGVPKACRILVPSPYVELDDGTCERAMTMRFEPPLGTDGEPVEAAYRARLTWLMSDPTRFGPALLSAELRLSGGEASDCRLARTGAVPREWMRFACLTLIGERAHFLGDRLERARRATIQIELAPDGSAAAARAGAAGALVARRRTAFELGPDGEIEGCRTLLDQGFAPRALDYSGECGLFLTQAWLERGEDEDSPTSGTIEIRVFVE